VERRGKLSTLWRARTCSSVAWSWSAWSLQEGSFGLSGIASDCWHVVVNAMPYLTNNQRMDLGLEGACCVKDETLEKKKPAGYYVEGSVEKKKPAAKKAKKKAAEE